MLLNKDFALQPKVECVSANTHAIGVSCPYIPMLKRLTAIVLICHFDEACVIDGSSKREIALAIQKAIKAKGKADRLPFGHIEVYPHDPAHLPEAMYKHAFSEEAPVKPPIETAHIARIAADVPYKKIMQVSVEMASHPHRQAIQRI